MTNKIRYQCHSCTEKFPNKNAVLRHIRSCKFYNRKDINNKHAPTLSTASQNINNSSSITTDDNCIERLSWYISTDPNMSYEEAKKLDIIHHQTVTETPRKSKWKLNSVQSMLRHLRHK